LQGILSNKILWAVLISLVGAQVLKVLIVLITERKFDRQRIRGTGGMPSSHSSSVTALAASVGFVEGFSSSEFTIALVLAFVVMYDAMGIRRAAGRHAEILNELMQDLADSMKDGFKPETLRTLLGHTFPQVVGGAILGILVSMIIFL